MYPVRFGPLWFGSVLIVYIEARRYLSVLLPHHVPVETGLTRFDYGQEQ